MHLHSFWWRVIKRAYKNASKPFDSVGRAFTIFAGLVGIGYITHRVTQEWGDYMIYWSVAFPVIVLIIWFIWNLIKVPHQIHEEDLAALRSGRNQSVIDKTLSPKLVSFAFIVIIVFAFMWLLAAKNREIAQLQQQMPSERASMSKPKPLPDKIIPVIVATNQNTPPSIVIPTASASAQFESNAPNIETSGDAYENAYETEKRAQDAQKAAIVATNNLDDEASWRKTWPLFNHSLETLYNALNEEAAKNGDGIAKTVGYFRCLPLTVNCQMEATNVAEIKLQIKTNMDFTVSVTKAWVWAGGPHDFQPNGLKISCGSGNLELAPFYPFSGGDNVHTYIRLPDFSDDTVVPDNDPQRLVDKGIKILVDAQLHYISQTNHAP